MNSKSQNINSSKGNAPEPNQFKDRIDEFIPEDSAHTPFSAATMNEIVRVINRNSNVIGRNGIIVKKSESNIVIAVDPKYLSGSSSTITGDTTNITQITSSCVCRYA